MLWIVIAVLSVSLVALGWFVLKMNTELNNLAKRNTAVEKLATDAAESIAKMLPELAHDSKEVLELDRDLAKAEHVIKELLSFLKLEVRDGSEPTEQPPSFLQKPNRLVH
jgi:uncharacterized membrane protein affecting hemolysin expression